MKALTVIKQGRSVAPNIEFVDDFDMPSPATGELLIRTEASALNHLDLWVGRGLPGIDLTYPRIGGSDGVGIVEAVGQAVDDAWIGQRVIMNAAQPIKEHVMPGIAPASPDIHMIGEHSNGAHAEFFTVPANSVVAIGDTDPVEAAAFGLSYLTAWRMLRSRANLQPGQTVLITGIGGGVALSALNICIHFGCEVLVTSRHQSKLDRAIELGTAHGVLDKGNDWSREVRKLTHKRGVDVCVDSIGKAIHLSCVKSLARGGIFVTCGTTTGPDATTDLARVFWNQLTIIGSTMGNMQEFREVLALLRTGDLKPVIDSVYDANEGRAAYERLESGEQFGKVVIRWS